MNNDRLRTKQPEYFKRVDLFYAVCQLLGSYHFKAPVRKYILEIFDMRFTPELLQQLDEVGNATEAPPSDGAKQQAKGSTENTDSSEQKSDAPGADTRKGSVVITERPEPRVQKIGFDV